MPKRLVVCCDGTWNRPDQVTRAPASTGGVRMELPAPTNVAKLALAVSPQDGDGVQQCTYYHRGVGTTRRERLRGGAFGLGLAANVRDAYRFLVNCYEPGDELYFFGFSRGAFTARSAAGFVRNAGILRPEHADRLSDAYALYRSRGAHPVSTEATLFRRTYSYETRIKFIGVWDTVGALGIPVNGLRILNRRNQFHDVALSSTVDAAYQALAIDERRRPFRPAVWLPPTSDTQVVEQVWFAGVHCDVGGGNAHHGLSDIPLEWLVGKAVEHGLAVDAETLKQGRWDERFAGDPTQPDPLAPAGNSYTSFYRLTRPWRRPIGATSTVSESASSTGVLRRERDQHYRPPNLDSYLDDDGRVTPV
ncbi:DUF2235 domain-containing protein [uncultured Jatrophihabitans sp.]|uniref:DUF2235 domain-containing protein n=1 Tax=uncultured Jatrophihabitans sp. TaxID=1610747 RepID=UPI0035CB3C79